MAGCRRTSCSAARSPARATCPDAIAALREAVTLDPDQGDALTNLGALLAQQGDVAQAGRLFARAATADPRNANARANYALFLVNSNRLPEALAEAQAALALNPQQATAQQVVGCPSRRGAVGPLTADPARARAGPAGPRGAPRSGPRGCARSR